ncbi:hypothetical protein K1719_000660 [Acacia pycnantha]|nr:hypothetical protein K1719_000660 [Acacia pycnantha]
MTTTYNIISLALVLFLLRLTLLSAQPSFTYHKCFIGRGTYPNKSPYQNNLNTLLSNIASDTIFDYGFYTSTYGQSPNVVHVRGLCRGDVNLETCRSCLLDAKTLLPKVCPNQKEAFGYSGLCIFHYASRPLLGYLDPQFSYGINNPQDAINPKEFKSSLSDLLKRLKSEAASGDSNFKLAVGYKEVNESQIVYGLTQCSPDLSEQDCEACLDKAISDIRFCCQNKIGGRVIKLSCNLQFEIYHFYND